MQEGRKSEYPEKIPDDELVSVKGHEGDILLLI